jgi:hypothetical protein
MFARGGKVKKRFFREKYHMKRNALGVGLLLILSGAVFGQETLVGKYSGHYVFKGSTGDRNQGLTLEITSAEGDAVKGKAVRMGSGMFVGCNGEYPVEGKLKGNALILRSVTKSGPAGDCSMTLRLTVEGNKLVGTLGQMKAELSK